MSEYSMYVCPECRKVFKVKGNNKKVKCSQCSKDIFDMSISFEEWNAMDKDSRETIMKNKCNLVLGLTSQSEGHIQADAVSYIMYLCPNCKKTYKVKGHNKKINPSSYG